MAKYTPDAECFNAARAAAGDGLSADDINDAFQRIADYRERLRAEGDITKMADKLRDFATREAERTQLAAAMRKRHVALNILVRDRQEQAIDGLMRAGLTGKQALLAVLEGTARGVEGGRNSVGALNLAYEARYLGGLMADLSRDRPHLVNALRDQKLDADITREMMELKEGGNPGVTGNQDAIYVAKVFASYAEMSRVDLNNLGAMIGKLDGWAGVQVHDDVKLIAAGKENWIDGIMPRLNVGRTFPDAANMNQVRQILGEIFDELVTGVPNQQTPLELGQRIGPANLAKQLGKSRVLHFKDADAALAYRADFGYGNTVSGMFQYLRNAARHAANMEGLGPNPENMYQQLIDATRRKVSENPNLSSAEKEKQVSQIVSDAGPLRDALNIATGLIDKPANVTFAKIASDIRAVQSMAKLGGALLSSVSEVVTPAVAAMFRGSGFYKGLVQQMDGIRRGRPKGEFQEITFLTGEGFDGLIGHIVHPAAAQDGPVGWLGKQQVNFFKWNGLTWWTDVGRATAGRVIAAEMGMRSKVGFDALPANYRHVLGLHGIDARKWDVIRKAQFREEGGNVYVTPDRIRALDDSAIAPLVRGNLETAKPEARAAMLEDARRDMELSVLRFIADETNYGFIEPDARSRRSMTWGQRPGTLAGEAIRFVLQFKSYPVAFTQRVWGRALYGHRKDASRLERAAHIGTLIGGITMAGYMSMTMKDLARGYWPPRDPSDIKTIGAALIQGGAFGLYGDFLFAETNRFGGGFLDTIAGPTIGTASNLLDIAVEARSDAWARLTGDDSSMPAARAFSEVINNVPYSNLFYTRSALDYLMLNSIRDALSPGYLRRQETRRRNEYGQESSVPRVNPVTDDFIQSAIGR